MIEKQTPDDRRPSPRCPSCGGADLGKYSRIPARLRPHDRPARIEGWICRTCGHRTTSESAPERERPVG
ncbi:MAG: hypothetical protein IPK07_34800 [Deltaproteobacteria bacterium]|nr:hypothetical protein [Deltaproteobacteria bacterium]